jgi:hypothetical protein
MELTVSGRYDLPFDGLNLYPLGMASLALDTSSWSR